MKERAMFKENQRLTGSDMNRLVHQCYGVNVIDITNGLGVRFYYELLPVSNRDVRA